MTASIGDYVWNDINADGIQNEDASFGINDVSVVLFNNAGVQIGTPTTTANGPTGDPGYYSFDNVAPGDYYVVFQAPAGFVFTTRFASPIESDSNPDSTGTSDTFTLFSGTENPSIDAGLVTTASVGNFVWWDQNADGLQVDTEPGIEGATVRLLQNGIEIDATLTDEFGVFSFTGLIPGSYSLQFDYPVGFPIASPSDVGNNTGIFDMIDSDGLGPTLITAPFTLAPGETNRGVDQGFYKQVAIEVQKTVRVDKAGVCIPGPLGAVDNNGDGRVDGGIQLGNLSKYLFFIANGSTDANWQGASKGFAGNVVVDGIQAKERTSGTVPFAGNLITNDTTLGAWQAIVDKNAGQATRQTGQQTLVAGLEADLASAFSQINRLAATSGFRSVSATSLNGLNTQDGVNKTYVINVTSGFEISTKINIKGDSGDVYVLRWDSDANFADGYEGQVKFKSGGAIVPLGGLTAGNFIHVAGDINASGGGSTPASPYPAGPRINNGTGALIAGGKDFSGGGFFTGYWLTTGAPTATNNALVSGGKTSPFSNAIFVGGWYTLSNGYSMTSGTSGVHVCVNEAAVAFDPLNIGSDLESAKIGDKLVYSFKVTNTNDVALTNLTIRDNNATPFFLGDDFTPAQVLLGSHNFGDINRNGIFDAGESWYFRTTQVATSSGMRINGVTVTAIGASLTVSDTDTATVIIAAALPAALPALSLAATTIAASPNFNATNPTDVNNDGVTSPLDALLVINRLNTQRGDQKEARTDTLIYDDVNNDYTTSPLDALLVINSLLKAQRLPNAPVAEGESDDGTDTFFGNFDDRFADIYEMRSKTKSKRSL